MTPALLMSKSMLLCAAMICSAAARTDACADRSRATSSREAAGTPARMSSTAAAAFSWLRTAITTCAAPSQLPRRLQPEAAVSAGHDRYPATLVGDVGCAPAHVNSYE